MSLANKGKKKKKKKRKREKEGRKGFLRCDRNRTEDRDIYRVGISSAINNVPSPPPPRERASVCVSLSRIPFARVRVRVRARVCLSVRARHIEFAFRTVAPRARQLSVRIA